MSFLLKSLGFSFVFTLLLVATAAAQPNNPPQGDPDVVPITGVEYLILGGSILGGYKLIKKKNSDKP